MIIDTHSHLQFNAFKDDKDEVIKKTLAENIWMINVGTKLVTSRDAVLLAENYGEGVYSAIGMHPMYAASEFLNIKHDPNEEEYLEPENRFDKEKYLALAKSKKVVAIGEIGLDYYYKPKTVEKLVKFKDKQKQIFMQQLELAEELKLPVILHCRMAHDDVIDILNSKIKVKKSKLTGVVHCFTGTLEQAKKYINLGFYLGINGIIFKFNIDEVIKNVPLENMLLETDCPYLVPPQEAGKRNEPMFIRHTINKVADLKVVDVKKVEDLTTQNAKKLFNI